MGTRTVRLDNESENTLKEIRKVTGLSISEVIKRGLLAYKQELRSKPAKTPYEIFKSLDLGPGGYALDSAVNSKQAVKEAIKRKLKR